MVKDLPYRARIWVPVSIEKKLAWEITQLAIKAGGYTQYPAGGAWTNDHGEVGAEPVTVYEVVYGDNNWMVESHIKLMAANMLAYGEQAVLLEIKGKAELHT